MNNISSQEKTVYEQLRVCLDTVYLLKTENLLLKTLQQNIFLMGKTLFTRFVQVGQSVCYSHGSHFFKCKCRLGAGNAQSKWRLSLFLAYLVARGQSKYKEDDLPGPWCDRKGQTWMHSYFWRSRQKLIVDCLHVWFTN